MRTEPPRAFYDLVANAYDQWHWQTFWRNNERPVVATIVAGLRPEHRSIALDLGCGTGLYPQILANSFDRVLGCDISRRMLAEAQKKAVRELLAQASLPCLPFQRGAFDLILMTRVLSHLADLEATLAEVERCLSKQGHLIITDLDPAYDYNAMRFRSNGVLSSTPSLRHSINELNATASSLGLVQVCLHRPTWHDLKWRPSDRAAFGKVDRSGALPIFYVAVFERE